MSTHEVLFFLFQFGLLLLFVAVLSLVMKVINLLLDDTDKKK